jgi:hypothetical protein
MPTSGASTFNLDLNNLIEEAFERCGSQLRSGYDMRTARRSMNLLTIEWANRGINLWTIEQCQIPLVMNQGVYPLPVDTIDSLDMVTRNGTGQNQTDINITRISESTYSTIPNKLATGRPIQCWVNRQSGQQNSTAVLLVGAISATDTTITLSSTANLTTTGFIKIDNETIGYTNVVGNQLQYCTRGQANTVAASHLTGASVTVQNLPCINIWPTPQADDTYTFVYYRMRRIQDAGAGGSTEPDIPFRFLPVLVSGLAFLLGQKIPDGQARLPFLKQEYEEQWLFASTEDRDKASDRYVPRNMTYTR